MSRRILLGAVLAAGTALLAAGCGSSGGSRTDLAFVSSRDGAYAIYGMNAEGSHQQRLTRAQGDPSTPKGLFFQVNPAWSPDGRRIAFASKRDGTFHIFAMNAEGTGTRRLTNTKDDDDNPTWSPDGKLIAFEREAPGDIYVMNADGSGAHRLVKDDATEEDPAWSPDGRWIAYVRRIPGTPVKEIWLVRPDGSTAHRLLRLGTSSVAPAWSPDAKRIAFSSDGGQTSGLYAVYTVGLDGKQPRRLTTEISTGAFDPAWSPDGEEVAYSSDGSIFTVTLVGSQKALTEDENNTSPAWRPVRPTSGY
jgi:Tol biopolymer transport system component